MDGRGLEFLGSPSGVSGGGRCFGDAFQKELWRVPVSSSGMELRQTWRRTGEGTGPNFKLGRDM